MVLPPTEINLRQQERKLRKLTRKRSSIIDDSLKQEAKDSAEKAASEALSALASLPRGALDSRTTATNYRGDRSVTSRSSRRLNRRQSSASTTAARGGGASRAQPSASDQESVISTELAIQRGSLRALNEDSEQITFQERELERLRPTSPTRSIGTLDLRTTTTDDASTSPKKSRRKRFLRRPSFSKLGIHKKSNSSRSDSNNNISGASNVAQEAWLCGCCGKLFATYETAALHEQRCIIETIEVLGFAAEGSRTNVNTKKESGGSKSAQPLNEPSATPISNGLDDNNRRERFNGGDAQTPFDSSARRTTRHHPSLNSEVFFSTKKSRERYIQELSRGLNGDKPSPTSRPMIVPMNGENDNVSPLISPPRLPRNIPDDFSDPGVPLSPKRLFALEEQMATLEGRFESPFNKKMKNSASVASRRQQLSTSPTRSTRSARNRAKREEVDSLLISQSVRESLALTDEGLVSASKQASELMLSLAEKRAEVDLQRLCDDKAYYDTMSARARKRQSRSADRFRSEGEGIISNVRNKFVDAYQLIKEGDHENAALKDEYDRKGKGNDTSREIVHGDSTMYLNVMVKNSVSVVRNELERLAKQRWEDHHENYESENKGEFKFERFRSLAHGNFIKLAGLALASDFTPRKVAVQLSNDLYRLIVPRLKRRGVMIETEIEYRVGPYFVLAVNVRSINWIKLMKYTHKLVNKRRSDWKSSSARREELRALVGTEGEDEKSRTTAPVSEKNLLVRIYEFLSRLRKWTEMEIVGAALWALYFFHWIISLPICYILFGLLSRAVRRFVLSTVIDDIFSWVEERGMEMEISVMPAKRQAAFMLGALREIREDSRELKKKKKEGQAADKGTILGPLLGPAIKSDKGPAPGPPPGFEVPESLEFIGLEIDLPVGFKRLRWALMSVKSSFVDQGLQKGEAKYDNVVFEDWNKHNEVIGAESLPPDVNEEDLIGAERETSYLMPKSAFVAANTAYETNIIVAYNDYCFAIKRRTRTPDVPFGSTFVCWTQLVFTNTGNDTCHMVCSTEAEFPNGPPMASRQIKSGMRAGTAEAFVLMSEAIAKYADEFP